MKSLLIAGAGVIALAMQSAVAADLPARPIFKAAPVEVWSWTGFYIGLNGGYSWGRSATDVSFSNSGTGAVVASASDTFRMNGGVFGGQIGYNIQSGNWVYGIEADAQWTGQRGSDSFVCPVVAASSACIPGATFLPTLVTAAGGQVLSLSQKLEWLATVRGRLGMTLSPTWLVYATGGFAFGTVTTDASFNGVAATGGLAGTLVTATSSVRQSMGGWTLGGGIEGRIADNLTAKVEYLYVDLGSTSGALSLAPSLALASNWTSRITDNIFRVGINYKFGMGPIVARY